ncbi:MAG: hypothetical protein D6730_07085 [Bacteroidetes bacterium]|nr:MAG: hypothetical protein D6730_07085 [Bacteroidota bacterium]
MIQVVCAQAETITREFPARNGQKLVIDLSIGADIKVVGWDENRIQVKVNSEDADDYDMRFIRNSWGLKIEAAYLENRGAHKGEVEILVKVPEVFDLELKTLGGDIRLKDIEGDFRGKTLGGDLKFEDLRGYVEMATLGGDVEVSDSELDGQVKTLGGDVEFEDVRGNVQARALGGEVRYDNYRPREDVDDRDWELMEEERGEYRQERRPTQRRGPAFEMYEERPSRSRNYHFEFEYPDADERFDRDRRPVKIEKMGGDIHLPDAPDGAELKTMGGTIEIGHAGALVIATTHGGDIRIEEAEAGVKATTFGGDISVNLEDNGRARRESELVSYGGDVVLYVGEDMDFSIEVELAYTRNHSEQTRIVSDLPLEIEESREWVREDGVEKRYLYGRGKLGNGRHKIRIRSVNGNVYLRMR